MNVKGRQGPNSPPSEQLAPQPVMAAPEPVAGTFDGGNSRMAATSQQQSIRTLKTLKTPLRTIQTIEFHKNLLFHSLVTGKSKDRLLKWPTQGLHKDLANYQQDVQRHKQLDHKLQIHLLVQTQVEVHKLVHSEL